MFSIILYDTGVWIYSPLTVRFSIPHSNMIQPHFSIVVAERPKSAPPVWVSVSSTSESSSISSRPNSTLDFSNGIAVMVNVPVSTERDQAAVRKHPNFKPKVWTMTRSNFGPDLSSPGLEVGCGSGGYWALQQSLCPSRFLHWSVTNPKIEAAFWSPMRTSLAWRRVGHVRWCLESPLQYLWKEARGNMSF